MIKKQMILFVVSFLIFLLFNFIFPLQSDDMVAFLSATSGKNFLHSYFSWNGRFGEIFYTGCLASINSSLWFDFINSLVGTIFIFIFFFLIFARLPKDRIDYFSLVLMWVMIVNMNFADIFLWGSGSLNYLWGIGLVLLFLIPYRIFWGKYFMNMENYSLKKSVFWCFYLLPFSVFAGWSSEHIGATVCCLLVVSIGYAYFKKIKLPLWYYIGMIGFLSGWLILFFSPGSAIRATQMIDGGGFIPLKDLFSLGILKQMILLNETLTNFYHRGFVIFYCCFLVFFIYKMKIKMNIWRSLILIIFAFLSIVIARHISGLVVFGFVFYLIWKLTRYEKKYYLFLFLFAVWMLIALVLLQLRGDIAQRAHFGDGLILGVLMILMFRDFYQVSIHKIFLQRGLIVALVFSLIACFCNWAYVGYNWKKIEAMVEEQKAKGAKEIVIPKNLFYSYYSKGWGEPGVDPNWINSAYARYFGVDKFTVQ